MIESAEVYLLKAQEALLGADAALASGRPNNCANRCYYACFHAAVYALNRFGVVRIGRRWTHEAVQAQFVGQLINRRKLYSSELRGTLALTQNLRETADYREAQVSQRDAARCVRAARAFVDAVVKRERS